MKSEWEVRFGLQLKLASLPAPETEYKFHPTRRWRFDFCWPDKKLALEVEGGTYSRGRHVRAAGFEKDCEKYNEAVILGYRLLRVTGHQVKTGEALAWTKAALG